MPTVGSLGARAPVVNPTSAKRLRYLFYAKLWLGANYCSAVIWQHWPRRCLSPIDLCTEGLRPAPVRRFA